MTAVEEALGTASPVAARQAAFEVAAARMLGPLGDLIADSEVSEIMVNGPSQIYVERAGRMALSNARFESEAALLVAVRNIAQFVGKQMDERTPIMDGRLPDGSRVCVIRDPVAKCGTSIAIRRFHPAAQDFDFLLRKGSVDPEPLEFLQWATRFGTNIIVSGGTGTGKTTFVNIMTRAFDPNHRIVAIEDTRELQIGQPHLVQLEARPADRWGEGRVSARDLFIASLRMRPDRIIVGEVRGGEAFDLVQAMNSGHRGVLATLHADAPIDACRRLETMAMLADVGIPLAALRRQVASGVDLVVQLARLDGGRKVVMEIADIEFDEEADRYRAVPIYRRSIGSRGEVGELAWTGSPSRVRSGSHHAVHAEEIKLCAAALGLEA